MTTLISDLPDLDVLTSALTSVFSDNGSARGAITAIHRASNVYASTFPSEILRCTFDDGTELELMCKYQTGSNYDGHGHWGELAYEAMVYCDVLRSSCLSAPKFFGVYRNNLADQTLLAIEYLDNTLRINKLPQPETMGAAARWIGRFHAQHERNSGAYARLQLKQYDADYYVGWAKRTSKFAGSLHQRFSWLASLCDRFDDLVAPLLAADQTIIHGEYQPHNILSRDGIIYPIDWQSAALAAGEIDLVALTDGFWSEEIVNHCIDEYKQERWPAGAPASFEQALGAAQLYWPMRWLGDLAELTTDESLLWRFDQLRAASERLGVA